LRRQHPSYQEPALTSCRHAAPTVNLHFAPREQALNVDWTSNAAERGVKPAKRHQAVSGYWQTHQTLNRWCLINSYLTTTRNHGLTVLNAITRALTGQPWLPAAA
jgi:hypothetical protein